MSNGAAGMVKSMFEAWLFKIAQLTPAQRVQAAQALAAVEGQGGVADGAATAEASTGEQPTPQTAMAVSDEGLLARIGRARIESFGCPHCGLLDVRPWGRTAGRPRYRCADCRRTFNPLTGTPLAGLHHQDRWADQAQALIDGDTLGRAARRCGVAHSTAFRWRHRFLSALNLDKPQRLSGIVEADETFILESFKGSRGKLARPSRKRGGHAGKRGLSAEQIPVIVARDRTGATMDAVLPNMNTASMTAALGHVIGSGVDFCCDGGSAITAFARRARVKLHVLPAPGMPKPDAPQFHINNVNAYHGRLKEWMRRFHGVATENLPSYLSWRRTLEALTTQASQDAWIMGAAGLGPYQQGST